jgi:hypothetical protein
MIKEGVLAWPRWRAGSRLLSDAVVVEVLGDLGNCPAADAEPAML